MHKFLIGILTAWLCIPCAHGQRQRPDWIDHPPTATNYRYFVGVGSSYESGAKARIDAINSVLSVISLERGFRYTIHSSNSTRQTEKNKVFDYDGVFVEVINRSSKVDFLEDLTIKEEYTEEPPTAGGTKYDHWVLMKIPVIKKWKAIARSALIPGLGQAYKGQKLKGGILFALCAGSLLTGVIAHNRSASAINQTHLTRDTALIRMYTTQSDNWEDLRNGAFALAAASYVYNLVDVSAGRGSRMYAYSAPGRIRFQPQFASHSIGLSCTFMIK